MLRWKIEIQGLHNNAHFGVPKYVKRKMVVVRDGMYKLTQQNFGKVPTLPIESGGEEEITDFDNTLYIS